jgi:hypothetical protein
VGRVVKATLPAVPHPTPDPVTETPTRKEVTTTSKKGKTAKSAPRVTVGPKQATVTKSNKPAKPGKTSQPKSKKLLVPTQHNQSPIKITDLLDNLPLNACVELTCRLLTSVTTIPSGQTRSQAVLKIFVLFVGEYGSTA